MSGAERHVVTGTTPPKHEGGEREYFTAVVVLASDYDRDTRALKERADAEQEAYDGQRHILDAVKAERDTFKAECVNLNNILDQIRIERDALRAQVEAMQYALNHILAMQTRGFITLGDNATSMANDALQVKP